MLSVDVGPSSPVVPVEALTRSVQSRCRTRHDEHEHDEHEEHEQGEDHCDDNDNTNEPSGHVAAPG